MTPRFVYITSRDRRDVFERLSTEFATQPDIHVMRDRRRGQRRHGDGRPAGEERRRRDRRGHPDLEQELRAVGSFITSVEDARPWHQ